MRVIGGLAIIAAVIAAIVGWVLNIVQLFGMADGGITGTFVLKAIGIFVAPLGAVLGWIG
jgi:hypothetical protein